MRFVVTGLKAGYSAENALLEAGTDLSLLYGERSVIGEEAVRLKRGLENHVPAERILLEMGSRYESEEIGAFAEVFAIAKQTGGSLPEILTRTAQTIETRMEVEREIAILTRAKRMEADLMSLAPLAVLLCLRFSMGDYLQPLYTRGGFVPMTLILALYAGAVLLSWRISDIRMD